MTFIAPISAEQDAQAALETGVQLEKLMRVRLRKCIALLPRALSEDDPDVVHDLRVWSRRLQQVIVTMFPGTPPPAARAMIRALRQARRALGGWRDCDVVIAILRRKLRYVRDPEQTRVWEMVLASAQRQLHKQMRRARRKIANRKMFTLAHKGEELLKQESPVAGEPKERSLAALQDSIASAYQDWRAELDRARDSDDAAEIHAFRIQSKRLRYRIELLRDLGSASAKAALGSLKALQDELGRWHDNLALTRITAEALADPDFLTKHPVAVANVLRGLDRDKNRHLNRVRRLLVQMYDEVDASPLHAAIAEFLPSAQPETAVQEPPAAVPEGQIVDHSS